eukprot:scaffold69143_cov32-Tisochrysis_lutea.AAC.1
MRARVAVVWPLATRLALSARSLWPLASRGTRSCVDAPHNAQRPWVATSSWLRGRARGPAANSLANATHVSTRSPPRPSMPRITMRMSTLPRRVRRKLSCRVRRRTASSSI